MGVERRHNTAFSRWQQGQRAGRAKGDRTWSAPWIAEQLGVAPATVYNWLAGKGDMSLSHLRALHRLSGGAVDLAMFMHHDGAIGAPPC